MAECRDERDSVSKINKQLRGWVIGKLIEINKKGGKEGMMMMM